MRLSFRNHKNKTHPASSYKDPKTSKNNLPNLPTMINRSISSKKPSFRCHTVDACAPTAEAYSCHQRLCRNTEQKGKRNSKKRWGAKQRNGKKMQSHSKKPSNSQNQRSMKQTIKHPTNQPTKPSNNQRSNQTISTNEPLKAFTSVKNPSLCRWQVDLGCLIGRPPSQRTWNKQWCAMACQPWEASKKQSTERNNNKKKNRTRTTTNTITKPKKSSPPSLPKTRALGSQQLHGGQPFWYDLQRVTSGVDKRVFGSSKVPRCRMLWLLFYWQKGQNKECHSDSMGILHSRLTITLTFPLQAGKFPECCESDQLCTKSQTHAASCHSNFQAPLNEHT